MKPQQALENAIRIAGGGTALARMLGVRQSVVSMWETRMRRGTGGCVVPAEMCPSIEKITGVPCEQLNPGVEWGVLRRKKPPGKRKAKK